MSNVAVIGSQWGDEGKGKVVDWLSHKADVVVRFQGGHNAGHTLVIDGVTYKLSLLPSGIVRPGKISIIGNGVVIDPVALLEEIEQVNSQGVEISPENLIIAENASLILPIHRHADVSAEASKKIGTTGRGIGPAYEDKVARRAIRVADLADDDILDERVGALVEHHNALRVGAGAYEISKRAMLDDLHALKDKILPFARPAWRELDRLNKEGKQILFEGAQGVMLDVDHGTYPFVTSSNTVAGAAHVGAGIGLGSIQTVLGITKAYTTRVGSGPFPTEQDNEIGQGLGERGHEFGTVTGRQRRCGWFDAVMVRQAVTITGITGIVLTKLDVMDGMETIKICTGYTIDDKTLEYFPASVKQQAGVEAMYEELPGWQETTHGTQKLEDLPDNARTYVNRIEELIGAPVMLISTSPKREDTITITDPFSV